jgi:hypothetical protein
MYRRYSQGNANNVSLSQLKRNRLKDLLILLLILGLGASLFFGIPAIRQRGDNRALYIQRIQAECDDAIRQTSTLSRNAGADSASILARIRCNLYAIRTLSALNLSQNGETLVSEDQIVTLQNTVDRYLNYLTTGMDTGEYQTNLQTALEELQEKLNALS